MVSQLRSHRYGAYDWYVPLKALPTAKAQGELDTGGWPTVEEANTEGDPVAREQTRLRHARNMAVKVEAYQPRGICADGKGTLYVAVRTHISRLRRSVAVPSLHRWSSGLCSVAALCARSGRLLAWMVIKGGAGKLSVDSRQRVLVAQEHADHVLELSLRLSRSSDYEASHQKGEDEDGRPL